MRTGIVATKLGMSSIFTQDGNKVPVTLLEVKDCKVVAIKNSENHGYDALVLGYNLKDSHKLNKPSLGFYKKNNIEPLGKVIEYRVSKENMLEVNTKIDANHFKIGSFIDVSAKSIGKGFAGVMKRHNFGGLRASHGVSIAHRSGGSTGGCQDPGKVFKGKKMAGQMGNKKVTIQNLEVVSVDSESKLICVRGSVPGAVGSVLKLRDSVKKY